MVWIHSEHAIGFLKGRFHSLKGLRVRIKDKKSHQFATYWVAACIGLHAFAMQCEADERERNNSDDEEDPFIAEGLSSDSDSDNENLVAYRARVLQGSVSGLRLHQARARRDQLKDVYLEQRRGDKDKENLIMKWKDNIIFMFHMNHMTGESLAAELMGN